jgi:DNA-binding MarR family transcriptional regulator
MSDGRVAPGPRHTEVKKGIALDTDLDLLDVVFTQWNKGRGSIAILAPVVVAGAGDTVASDILRRAARHHADLVGAGLPHRVDHPGDRRNLYLELTPQGHRQMTEIHDTFDDDLGIDGRSRPRELRPVLRGTALGRVRGAEETPTLTAGAALPIPALPSNEAERSWTRALRSSSCPGATGSSSARPVDGIRD